MSKCFSRVPVGLMLFALGRVAGAQQVHSVSAADALFKEGRQAAKQGDHTTACALFQKSYAFDPAPGTLMNIADCEERQGKLVDALRHFKVTAESLAPGDERVSIALARAASLDARMPHLVVRVVQGKNEPIVTLRGEGGGRIGKDSLDKPIALGPGAYTVTIYDGGGIRQETVTLAGSETREVLFNAEAIEREEEEKAKARDRENAERQKQVEAQIAASQATAQASMKAAMDQATVAQQDAKQRVNTGLALGGGLGFGLPGLTMLTIGIVMGANTLAYKATVDEHCVGKLCDEEGLEAARDGEKTAAAAPVFIAIGAPLTALGVYFAVKGFSQKTALSFQPMRAGSHVVLTHSF